MKTMLIFAAASTSLMLGSASARQAVVSPLLSLLRQASPPNAALPSSLALARAAYRARRNIFSRTTRGAGIFARRSIAKNERRSKPGSFCRVSRLVSLAPSALPLGIEHRERHRLLAFRVMLLRSLRTAALDQSRHHDLMQHEPGGRCGKEARAAGSEDHRARGQAPTT